ncbi:MAG: TRAP transporter large permease subunit [Desulfobacterota bacterium]|jgi:tripartite ATP-independent transporter DctM subunit|nr:TRAP transporter large permease subunit [Thermodesulfobacteriota bacterium]
MNPETLALVMFGTLFITLFLGHPLAFSLGILALVFGIIGWGGSVDVVMGLLANRAYGVMDEYVLVAVPLFIFMAQVLDSSGIAERLFDSMHILMGPVRGGLAIAVILACTVFAATAGVVGATEVSVGLLAIPALMSKKYNIPLIAGSICAGGTLGILIPPSIMLVVYGSLAAVSVGHLYAAAFGPGFLLSTLYIAYIVVVCLIRPDYGPALPKEERIHSLAFKAKIFVTSLVPAIVLVIIVLGSIVFGVATPTEAAGMGCAGAVLLALLYKKLTWKAIYNASWSTFLTTSMIMTLFLGGNAFQAIFMGLGGGEVVTKLLLGFDIGPMGVLFIMMGIVFFLGMFLDWLGILLIIIPIFVPTAMELGFNQIWFATLICTNLQMAFLTPPFGYSLFYLRGIAPKEMTIIHIYKGVVPFICLQWTALILCIIFPKIILWLPHATFGVTAVK